jgi:transposase-like protein
MARPTGPRETRTMKRSRYSDEQIAYALRQAETGTAVADVCRQFGISDATFYVWKKKYANLGRRSYVNCGCCARRTRS